MSRMVDGVMVDELGNPMILGLGCPNCGKGKGRWLHPMEFVALENTVRPDGTPCSLVCEYQMEHAASLAARDVVQVAEAITTAASTHETKP